AVAAQRQHVGADKIGTFERCFTSSRRRAMEVLERTTRRLGDVEGHCDRLWVALDRARRMAM
ncbi:MAG: hypothetical protein WA879_06350, partial [Candidatus Acidiferrales bacterium]